MAAPMALNVTKAVVSGISSSARSAKAGPAALDTAPCDMSERPLPQLIEIRTDNAGATMYRPRNLAGPLVNSQTHQAGGQTGDLGAWRAMGNLAGKFSTTFQLVSD
jgi:hypothetical protein